MDWSEHFKKLRRLNHETDELSVKARVYKHRTVKSQVSKIGFSAKARCFYKVLLTSMILKTFKPDSIDRRYIGASYAIFCALQSKCTNSFQHLVFMVLLRRHSNHYRLRYATGNAGNLPLRSIKPLIVLANNREIEFEDFVLCSNSVLGIQESWDKLVGAYSSVLDKYLEQELKIPIQEVNSVHQLVWIRAFQCLETCKTDFASWLKALANTCYQTKNLT